MPELLVRLHKPALGAVVGLTIAATVVLWARGLTRDYSLRAFVSAESTAYDDYRRLTGQFVSNEFAVIAVKVDNVAGADAMALIERLAGEVRSLPQVERAMSLADVPELLRRVLGERLNQHPLFLDNFISRDGKTLALLLHMRGESATGTVRKETVERLKAIVAAARLDLPKAQIVLAGPYVTLIDMYDYVDRDLRVFSTVAFALLVVTLAVVFRRPAPALFALVVSLAATLWTLGLASTLSLPTTLITQMIVILVMVLSVANCVHLGVAEDEAFVRAPFYDWPERSRRVLARMAAPCAGAMVTTAVGFGSVSISTITPVRTFGLLMLVGLGTALVISLVLMPWLARVRPPSARAEAPVTLSHLLIALAVWVNAHLRHVVAIFAGGTVALAASIPWLRFESDFVKSFRPASEVRTSYEFIESNLSPAGSLEIVVHRADGGAILTAETIAAARRVGEQAVARYGPVRKAQTVADVLSLPDTSLPFVEIDPNTALAVARRLLGEEAVDRVMHHFVNADGTAMRINLRVTEGVQVRDKLRLADRLGALARDAFGPGYVVEVTGLYYFHATLVSELWRDQFQALGITVAAVFIVLVLTLRSLRVGVIAMVPATLPVVFCLGAMAWTGVPVNMTTAMMLSVAMGIAVDDIVHYLWRFRAVLRETGDYAVALRTSHASVGRACVFTTVVIALGFWVLMLSEFLPTAYFGGLLGLTMCGALAADLVLLPALVMILKPFRVPSGDGTVASH